jgi:uncharacterized protein (DUF983 family)
MSSPEQGPQPAAGESAPWSAEHLSALIGQRCPRCHKGAMFRSGLAMNDPCPVCGLVFQREEGYFLGAMYTSYLLAAGLLVPFYFLGTWLFPNWSGLTVAFVATLAYLPFIPAVFRYSRVLWIYLDRGVGSGESSDAAYEKARKQELAEKKAGAGPEG